MIKRKYHNKPWLTVRGLDRWVCLVLALVAGGLYLHTALHGYVLDDRLVITEHRYVMEGVEGIPTIMQNDAFVSLYEETGGTNTMTGGRYRPLSQVTFALETEVFGKDPSELDPDKLGDRVENFPGKIAPPMVGHIGNIVCYVLVVLAGYWFLRRLFGRNPWPAAFGMLFFAVHPLHAEVVANIKSRDELLSLLFLMLALSTAFRHLFLCTIFAVLALFSKEYAILLPILLPLLFWVQPTKAWRFWTQWILVALAVGGYLWVRFTFVPLQLGASPDLAMNAYAGVDDPLTAFASKIAALGTYLKLMVVPHPLIYSYSFEHLPFVDFTHWKPLVSGVVLLLIAFVGFSAQARRHPVGFLLLFMLGCLFLVSNLAFSVANVVAERLAFHASLGFCGVVGWAVSRSKSNPLFVVAVLIAALFGWLAFDRAKDWSDMETLYIADGDKAPNSVVIQGNAGAKLFDRFVRARANGAEPEEQEALLKDAETALVRATEIWEGDGYPRMNLGLVQFERGDLDAAHESWAQASGLLPGHPKLTRYRSTLADRLKTRGIERWRRINRGEVPRGKMAEAMTNALTDLERSAANNNADPQIWYWLNGAYQEAGDFEGQQLIAEQVRAVGAPAWRGFLNDYPQSP